MLKIKCQRENVPPRLYQFEDSSIRIGFRAESHVSLEPNEADGAEIAVQIRNEKLVVQATRQPGRFTVNGKPLIAPVTLETGEQALRAGPYRIQIDYVDDAGIVPLKTVAPESGADQGEHAEENAPSEPAAPKPAPKTAESYLLLFFEPIREYLTDPDVSEVMINGPSQIYIERKGKVHLTPAKFINEQALLAAVQNVARAVNRLFNKDTPRLDARLPDGSRVHAVIPPLARKGTVVAIRKFSKEKLTMEQLIHYGSISSTGANLLRTIIQLHKNVLVSGATSSGKTSVLNVLSHFIDPGERILVLEDASELQLQQEHTVCFETRKPDEHGKGEVTIRDLVHSALRLRPDRLIVGEIRGGEALDLLQAMNTGHDGSLSTIHANTPKDALTRLETCALLSGVGIPLGALREQVAAAVHVVVQTARLFDGSRKITQISEILGLENGQYKVQDLFVFRHESIDADGKLIGRHELTGTPPTFQEEARRRGMEL